MEIDPLIGTISGRVFARAKPTDLRKSFNTLGALVTEELGADLLSGDLFLFVNKRRNLAKLIYFDGTGLCIFIKRLEKARFAAPWDRHTEGAVRMSAAELALFLEGSAFVFVATLSPEKVVPTRVATKPLVVR